MFFYFPKINFDAFHVTKQQFQPSSTFFLWKGQNNTVEENVWVCHFLVMWPTLDSTQAYLCFTALHTYCIFLHIKGRPSSTSEDYDGADDGIS